MTDFDIKEYEQCDELNERADTLARRRDEYLAALQREQEKLDKIAESLGLLYNRSTGLYYVKGDWEASLPADYPAEDI